MVCHVFDTNIKEKQTYTYHIGSKTGHSLFACTQSSVICRQMFVNYNESSIIITIYIVHRNNLAVRPSYRRAQMHNMHSPAVQHLSSLRGKQWVVQCEVRFSRQLNCAFSYRHNLENQLNLLSDFSGFQPCLLLKVCDRKNAFRDPGI